MRRITSVIGIIMLALLVGCASLKKDAGFEIETSKADGGGVEVPWQSIALRGDVSAVLDFTVAMIDLPQPLPEVWEDEIMDSGRLYKQGKSLMTLQRSVWRTALYGPDGKVRQVFDAVLNTDKTTLFILLPLAREEEFKRGNWLVWFSDGTKVMTTRSAVVKIGDDVGVLSNRFFYDHPSPLPQHVIMRRFTPEGRKFFESLERRFPVRLKMPTGEMYSAETAVEGVGALTKGDNAFDNLVTCGSAAAVPSVTGMIVSVALSLPHNLSVAVNGCRRKGDTVKKEAPQSEPLLLSSSPTNERNSP